MTEFEIVAMIELDIAGVEIARCHVITGHGPSPQPAQSGVNPMPPQNARTLSWHDPRPPVPDRIAELEARVVQLEGINQGLCGLVLTRESELDAMTAERDDALLRMEVAPAAAMTQAETCARLHAMVEGLAAMKPELFAVGFPQIRITVRPYASDSDEDAYTLVVGMECVPEEIECIREERGE